MTTSIALGQLGPTGAGEVTSPSSGGACGLVLPTCPQAWDLSRGDMMRPVGRCDRRGSYTTGGPHVTWLQVTSVTGSRVKELGSRAAEGLLVL